MPTATEAIPVPNDTFINEYGHPCRRKGMIAQEPGITHDRYAISSFTPHLAIVNG